MESRRRIGEERSLCRLDIKAVLPAPVKLVTYSGFVARGIFYDLARRASPSLAKELHEGKKIAPFSARPISHEGEKGVRYLKRSLPSGPFTLTICLLDQGLWEALFKVITSCESLKIVEHECPVSSINVQVISYRKIAEEAKPVKKFQVRFRTPTYFRWLPPPSARKQPPSYRFMPLPIPMSMFSNLCRLWNAFSDVEIPCEDFLEWVEGGGIAVSGVQIRTERVYEHPTTEKWAVGFVGTAFYSLPDDTFDPKHARLVDALMRFAEYGNVGGNRTAGFGVVEYSPAEYSL